MLLNGYKNEKYRILMMNFSSNTLAFLSNEEVKATATRLRKLPKLPARPMAVDVRKGNVRWGGGGTLTSV
jgi:hypothetical protein